MKSTLIPAGLLLFLATVSGCASKQQQPTASALDVSAPTPASSYTPAPASPVLAAPDPVYSQTPAAGNGSYTVKKGDTLYRIAKDHYGDGKQWQKIASANPGVSPQSLKVGQTLVIP
jgi:5'-nucleotidase/UDP-sugar diphosphatase